MNVLVHLPTEEKAIDEFSKKVSLMHVEKIISYLKNSDIQFEFVDRIFSKCLSDTEEKTVKKTMYNCK